ncbi:MAG: CDP-alcohol phosphatidyltransferase family protein [Planctomycetaceae bacterium]
MSRRDVASRNTAWAARVAKWLAQRGVTPNSISIASIVFAAMAGVCLFLSGRVELGLPRAACFLGAILGIQLRLLCNLFDGMVAVEHDRRTKSGEIFNELPDRFSDLFIIAGAAYSDPLAPWLLHLGWVAATLAVKTAYIRALGASAGAGQHFLGPMAKQHRMAVMTLCCLIQMGLGFIDQPFAILTWGLGVMIVGELVTIVRRTWAVVRTLEAT